MVRQFIILARTNKELRQDMESSLSVALRDFMLARTVTDSRVVEQAVLVPSRTVSLQCAKKSLMSVVVPSISIDEGEGGQLYPYSFLTVTQQLDNSVATLNGLLVKLIQLAEIEKTCNMLANEIEKNKRRVNALENIMIPQMEETIKYIKMKLDENERASIVRLMKVKDIISKQAE